MKPDSKCRPTAAVRLEKVYPHPPEQVWRALTDPQALAQWLLPTTFKPEPGKRFRFVDRTDAGKPRRVRCRVVELEAPRRLAYTWQADDEDAATLVTWTLEAVAEGTRLRLEHVGLETSCALRASLAPCMSVRNAARTLGRLELFLQPNSLLRNSRLYPLASERNSHAHAQRLSQFGPCRYAPHGTRRGSDGRGTVSSRRTRV